MMQFVSDSWKRMLVVMLGLILEPLTVIMRWLLKVSRIATSEEYPPMCTFIHPRISPVVLARQHIAALLGGKSSRLIMVYGLQKFKTLCQWIRERPREAVVLRRLLLTIDSWIYRRHVLPFKRVPFSLACVVGDRRTRTERQSTSSAFMCAQPCCLDEFFGRRLRSKVEKLGFGDPAVQHILIKMLRRPMAVVLLPPT